MLSSSSPPSCTAARSYIILSDSNCTNSPSRTTEYTPERIKLLLKQHSTIYKVIKNEGIHLSSSCWQVFGYPAKKWEESNQFERIQGFASCQSCYQTFAYASSTGTRNMNAHACVKNLSNSKITSYATTSSSSSCQMKLSSMTNNYKQVKLNEKELITVKNLTCSWLCQDMRSFTTVEDKGLRNLLQEFINLGAKHGEFDVKNAIRGADVMSEYIYKLADEARSKIRDLLKEPFEAGAICISPDLWSDSYKQIAYLGLSATFVDKNFKYDSIELCCKPYIERDQSGENLLTAIRKALQPFDIFDLAQLSFMSDRGANLVKALRDYETLFCFLHRINNILKRGFFQLKRKEKPSQSSTTAPPPSATSVSKSNHDDSCQSASSTEDEEAFVPTLQIKKKKQKKKQETRIPIDPMKLELKDLPLEAQEIIETIEQCKKLVRYIKKSGLNKQIQSGGGVALQQSTVVRWLSLINLLESIVRSFTVTKRILAGRGQQARLNSIDENVLIQLIRLLKPFKHILQLIQTGHEPSLYMVLICSLTLKKTLASFEEILKYQTSTAAKHDEHDKENETDDELEVPVESEGIRIIRLRILKLFDTMFQLDLRHYCATLLHPLYRQLKGCTNAERDETHIYVRDEMTRIINKSKHQQQQQQDDESPQAKKQKVQHSILQQYQDDDDVSQKVDQDSSLGSEDFGYKPPPSDELSRYLAMDIDKKKLSSNPLDFWREHHVLYPVLSKLARQIHCIPASSAAVERCFSSAGFIVNERRTALNPEQVDNIIVIRSMKNLEKKNTGQ